MNWNPLVGEKVTEMPVPETEVPVPSVSDAVPMPIVPPKVVAPVVKLTEKSLMLSDGLIRVRASEICRVAPSVTVAWPSTR